MDVLVATHADVFRAAPDRMERAAGLEQRRPTCLTWDRVHDDRAWCGTKSGLLRSDDAGASWAPAGLAGEHIMALTASRAEPGVLWAGTEPSALYRSDDGGVAWRRVEGLDALPSSASWAFPPRPDTHHIRWIAPHPAEAGRLWVAIEAGALVFLEGGDTWRDRVDGGPWDTHELAVHPRRPLHLRVAAGDGYYESQDGGESWSSPEHGLDVGYLRSVAIDPGDPDTVLISASSGPRSAYVAGRSDGRVYRREGAGRWQRVLHGWALEPDTIAPLIRAGREAGVFIAADERGVHESADGGVGWRPLARFPSPPDHLRGLAVRP